MSTQFDHASVVKKSNIFFDGKCIRTPLFLLMEAKNQWA